MTTAKRIVRSPPMPYLEQASISHYPTIGFDRLSVSVIDSPKQAVKLNRNRSYELNISYSLLSIDARCIVIVRVEADGDDDIRRMARPDNDN